MKLKISCKFLFLMEKSGDPDREVDGKFDREVDGDFNREFDRDD